MAAVTPVVRNMTVNVNRRDFLNRAAAVPLAAAVGMGLAPAAGWRAAQTPIKRAGGPRFKLSLNAYSFNKLLNDNLRDRGKGGHALRSA